MACNTCYAWRPTKWDSWHFVDEEATCSLWQYKTRKDYTCDKFSIVKPAEVTRTLFYESALMLDAEDMEGFDLMPINRAPYAQEREKAEQKIVVYEHQEETFHRFKDEKEMAIFFEQGLGKSHVALRIAAYKYEKGDINALLVVAPNDVHKQWAREQVPLWLDHYGCKYEVQLLGGKSGRESHPFRNKNVLQVICVNIDTFSTPKKWVEIAEWANMNKTFIVLDEATVIKNFKAMRTQRMLYAFNDVRRRGKTVVSSQVKSVARAVLTGTPVTEGPLDLWTIFEFLRPNYFSRNYYSFQQRYGMYYQMILTGGDGHLKTVTVKVNKETWQGIKDCKTYGEAAAIYGVSEDTYNTIKNQLAYEGPYKHADELKKLIEPVSVFKTLEECVDMPGKVYVKEDLAMSAEQAKLYADMENEFFVRYKDHEAGATSKMAAYTKLQQITSGFIYAGAVTLNEEGETDVLPTREVVWIDQNPKLARLYELVELDIVLCPVIIVTRFTAEAARIYEDLGKKMKCMLFTGWKKEGRIEDFQEGKYDVLVANERAISRGFNLQISHIIHFYSNTYSLEDRLQTEGRIFRIGQTKKARYVDYVCDGTVDIKIIGALRQKRKLLDYMRDVTITDFLSSWDEVAEIEKAGGNYER